MYIWPMKNKHDSRKLAGLHAEIYHWPRVELMMANNISLSVNHRLKLLKKHYSHANRDDIKTGHANEVP